MLMRSPFAQFEITAEQAPLKTRPEDNDEVRTERKMEKTEVKGISNTEGIKSRIST